ncbi:aminotransferase-like domain-containing protein [Larkinella soli]|uniref:aminotransferase-like domain-containing protein n=1 Tax=Larkinella soli TaxID=1770527 RepID=UPI000FFC2A31|nr:PLP-dependent aminotransferase family protein [Larkinella soli]
MIPFKTLITLDRSSAQPVFLQLAEQLGRMVREGVLEPGWKLPGTRRLAQLLDLHRRTVVAAYDELLAQGWLEARPGSGTYIPDHLPQPLPQALTPGEAPPDPGRRPGYLFSRPDHIQMPVLSPDTPLRLDDGFPDIRLAPMDELARAYRSYFRWGKPQRHFGYADTRGHPLLQAELSAYLNETRALRTTPENILITRGSIMGIHLSSLLLLRPGDTVVVGETNWAGADMNFRQAGAVVQTVPVDGFGLDVDALADWCRRRPVRLVYLTPHHHYPTTVTLRADRRLQLLQLSREYGFAVIEDDYDFDFHYLGRPILPLASADRHGMVIHVGSLSKSIAPAFRIGYVAAPVEVIDELARLRRIIDRQGDPMLEFAVGQLFRNGDIRRHLKKSLKTYQTRRDHFCRLLTSELAGAVEFTRPDGGLAVWTRFDPAIDLPLLARQARQEGLFFSDGTQHDLPGRRLNGTRLGFASSTEEELEKSVAILHRLLGRTGAVPAGIRAKKTSEIKEINPVQLKTAVD